MQLGLSGPGVTGGGSRAVWTAEAVTLIGRFGAQWSNSRRASGRLPVT